MAARIFASEKSKTCCSNTLLLSMFQLCAFQGTATAGSQQLRSPNSSTAPLYPHEESVARRKLL